MDLRTYNPKSKRYVVFDDVRGTKRLLSYRHTIDGICGKLNQIHAFIFGSLLQRDHKEYVRICIAKGDVDKRIQVIGKEIKRIEREIRDRVSITERNVREIMFLYKLLVPPVERSDTSREERVIKRDQKRVSDIFISLIDHIKSLEK